MKKLKPKQIKLISIIGGSVIFWGLIGFLGWKYWAPLGKKVRTTLKLPGAKEVANVDTSSPTGGFKLPSQVITTQAARFPLDIKAPNIANIHAVIKFKPGPKEIKLGIKGDEKDKYLYKPFYHMFVQEAKTWAQVKGISNILYQRTKHYNSIVDLIDNPPKKESIGAYFINMETLLKNVPGDHKSNVISTFLRGSHTFYIWVDSAPLNIKVSKQDINMYDGEDKFKINVYKGDKKIAEKEIPDDGMTTNTLLKKDPQTEKIELADITPGIYRLDLIYDGKGSDSIITRLEVNQEKIIAKSLFILDNKPSTIYTDSVNLTSQIIHEGYLAPIKVNDKFEISILQSGTKVTTDLETLTKTKFDGKNLFKLYSIKNDIVYSGDGYFAFSKDQYFNPDIIKRTDLNAVENLDDIDYIFTTLTPARQEGDWLVAEINFDPEELNITGDKLYFSLESPKLADYGGELEIGGFEVNIDYQGALEKFVKKPTEIPTAVPTLTQVKVATPTAISSKTMPIKILNGGAPSGTGTRLAAKLQTAGYANAKAENATDKFKNAAISYPEKYQNDLKAIEDIVKTEYKLTSRSINSQDETIIIKIGATAP